MEKMIAGLVKQPAQQFDRFVTNQISNLLFKKNGSSFGEDLAARNIQRGRDHGLASYSKYYELYGPPSDPNKKMMNWNERPKSFSEESWNLLKEVYVHPHDIDLFSGGLMEKKSPDEGLLGIVFRTINGIQFKKLLYGDRFFFTHKGKHLPVQINV